MKKPYLSTGTVLILCAALILTLISCSKNTNSFSFFEQLDEVDAFISMNEASEAVKRLKKLEKNATSVNGNLGIHKRYLLLNQVEAAEKNLKKSIKHFPESLELTAVYVQMLLRQKRINEALEASRKLSGTKYSSLYAEAVFSAAKERGVDCNSVFVPVKKYKPPRKNKKDLRTPEEIQKEFFQNPEMIPVYVDAWNSSKQACWLRNSGAICMKNGMYRDAVNLFPEEITSADDSLFWGIVLFDNGLYLESLECLASGEKYILNDEAYALLSDDYYILGEEKKSEEQRDKILSKIRELSVESVASLSDVERNIIECILLNTTRFECKKGDYLKGVEMLEKTLELFPSSEGAFGNYCELAMENYLLPAESEELLKLRKSGLKTLKMEEKDKRPEITVEKALMRLDEQLKVNYDEKLVILKEMINWQLNRQNSKQKKIAVLWSILEKNSKGKNLYAEEIMKFVAAKFISLGDDSDAYSVFTKYLEACKDSRQSVEIPLWEAEMNAWFCTVNGDFSDAVESYEGIAKKYGNRLQIMNVNGEQKSVNNAFVNLSEIYRVLGDREMALEMLNRASGRITDDIEKSEIIYRIALLYDEKGDEKNAVQTLKYALKLNNNHKKAQLLMKKLAE